MKPQRKNKSYIFQNINSGKTKNTKTGWLASVSVTVGNAKQDKNMAKWYLWAIQGRETEDT